MTFHTKINYSLKIDVGFSKKKTWIVTPHSEIIIIYFDKISLNGFNGLI